MNRWLPVALIVVLIVLAFALYTRRDVIGGVDTWMISEAIWLILALVLVSGAAYGFARFRFDKRMALLGAVFWIALFAAVVVAYQLFN